MPAGRKGTCSARALTLHAIYGHLCLLACPRRHLPLARDLVRVARQRLVFRLDAYCKRDNKLFSDVIK